MNTPKRAVLTALLLLSFTMAASPHAYATIETFTFQMHWTDFVNTYTTSGSFNFDNVTLNLAGYSIDVPAGFGTVTQANSTATLYINGGPCLAVNPCFALSIKELLSPPNPAPYNLLQLAFGGNLLTLSGGPIVPLSNGSISKAVCNDPCSLTLIPTPPVPEPSSMLLVTTGALGLAFRLRRAVSARRGGSRRSM
jgi:hypothetical protein